MYKLTGSPFNLTAIVLSDLNLTSLYWSPPELVSPLPNRTITVRNGNIVTTTFTSLNNASLGDSGNYTLTAVNECGQSSLQVDVNIGKLIDLNTDLHFQFYQLRTGGHMYTPTQTQTHTQTHTHTHTHTQRHSLYKLLPITKGTFRNK